MAWSRAGRPGRRRRPGPDGRVHGRRGARGDARRPARSTSTRARATACGARARPAATSLRLVDLAADCDGDALLVTVDPVGPTCHRGTRSCFDPAGAPRRARARRGSPGSRRCGRRSPTAPATGPPAPTRPGCSPAASTPPAARSPRRRPRSCSPPRTTRRPRSSGADRSATRDALAGEAADLALPRPGAARRARPAAPSAVIETLRARHRR